MILSLSYQVFGGRIHRCISIVLDSWTQSACIRNCSSVGGQPKRMKKVIYAGDPLYLCRLATACAGLCQCMLGTVLGQ